MPEPPSTIAKRRGAPLPRWLGTPLSWIYARVIRARNAPFDRRVGVVELDRPVVSVGNLSVGGTGKTPMVMHTVRELIELGRTPCIAMRGYGGRGARDGAGSDEAAEYSRAFPDVPVIAQPDRTHGLLDLFASARGENVDCIVLDDGFQHRQLARQLDLVLIDATADPFNDRLLPAGWLREPASSLSRAHAVIITHAESVTPSRLTSLSAQIADRWGKPPTAVVRHAWAGLRTFSADSSGNEADASWLRSRRVVASCAIGNPAPFLAATESAAREIVGTCVLPDHDPYAPRTIDRLTALLRSTRADALVVTSKDWSKLARVPTTAWPCPVAVPTLTLRFDAGREQLRSMLGELPPRDPDPG